MLRNRTVHVVKTEPLVARVRQGRACPGSDALYEVVVRAPRDHSRHHCRPGPPSPRRRSAVLDHDPEAALDYAGRLGALAERLADKLFVVMRVYFEKRARPVG